MRSILLRALAAALAAGGWPAVATAFSSGATVCEVRALPFAPMSPTLRQPPPAGWTLASPEDTWYPGALRRLRLVHPDPERRARGVLVWVRGSRFGLPLGAGRFVGLVPGGLYQYVGIDDLSGEDCEAWALTHRSPTAKSQAELVFDWQAPDTGVDGSLVVRAFLIEDCDPRAGVCRDAQALTPFLELREALFAEGFE